MNGERKSDVRLPPLSEKEFGRMVEQLAKLLGYRVYHSWLSARSSPGFPDYVLVRPPRLLFVELKSDRGQISGAQHQWLDALAGCPGVEVHVWRPSDWPLVEASLR
jgi:hypothetical protein